jgi:hypothetical protein
MADPPSSPERDTSADRPTTGTPRWVKVSGIIALTVLLLLLLMLLLTGGNHGPGRHLSSRELGGHLGSMSAVVQDRR